MVLLKVVLLHSSKLILIGQSYEQGYTSHDLDLAIIDVAFEVKFVC